MKKIIFTIASLLLLPSYVFAVDNAQITHIIPSPDNTNHTQQTKIKTTYSDSMPPEVARVQAKMQGQTLIIQGKKPEGKKSAPARAQLDFYYPRQTLKKRIRLSSSTLYPGSLKENITRIASHFGWRHVVWAVPNDYNWVGVTRILGQGLPDILSALLKDYPVQAVFYRGNHVLLIRPRTLQ